MEDFTCLMDIDPNPMIAFDIEEESEILNYVSTSTETSKELNYLEQKFNTIDIKEKSAEEEKSSICSNKSTYYSSKSSCTKRKTNEYKKTMAVDSALKFKLETLLLALFKRKKPNKPPKKEYIRCTLIRGHKRSIRQSFQGIYPSKGIHKFLLTDAKSYRIWNYLTQICLRDSRDSAIMMEKSSTVKGPKTDGKSKRQQIKENDELKKSFNDDFCRSYFLEEVIKEHYYYYIKLLFAHFDCDILCEKFNFFCCEGRHTDICTKKWELLNIFVSDLMLTDIKIDPWFPIGEQRQKITLEDIDELSKVAAYNKDDDDISQFLA
ncbi:unnamed protein product [Blepharisma stoltei]|uniref:Uncharacterized protein n=1 Tax=Blepharisma stoltei TaxID=1481888 RepID=A0AAU9JQI6_9CILI|nr:unnamed protein product [Blepharisma stoltei]